MKQIFQLTETNRIVRNQYELNLDVPKVSQVKKMNSLPFRVKTSENLKTFKDIKPLSANPTKRSNTLKQFVVNFPTNCLSVFDHFMGLALKGLKIRMAWHVIVGCVIVDLDLVVLKFRLTCSVSVNTLPTYNFNVHTYANY